jgi:hypothetical protein
VEFAFGCSVGMTAEKPFGQCVGGYWRGSQLLEPHRLGHQLFRVPAEDGRVTTDADDQHVRTCRRCVNLAILREDGGHSADRAKRSPNRW